MSFLLPTPDLGFSHTGARVAHGRVHSVRGPVIIAQLPAATMGEVASIFVANDAPLLLR